MKNKHVMMIYLQMDFNNENSCVLILDTYDNFA